MAKGKIGRKALEYSADRDRAGWYALLIRNVLDAKGGDFCVNPEAPEGERMMVTSDEALRFIAKRLDTFSNEGTFESERDLAFEASVGTLLLRHRLDELTAEYKVQGHRNAKTLAKIELSHEKGLSPREIERRTKGVPGASQPSNDPSDNA